MKIFFGWVKKMFSPNYQVVGGGESHGGYAGLCSPTCAREASRDH